MSRSRKKSPFIGYTTALSDKPWKAKASCAFRHAAKQSLDLLVEGKPLPEKRYEVTNPCDAPKDGKQRVVDGNPKWLRK